jgi:hypothetical protein
MKGIIGFVLIVIGFSLLYWVSDKDNKLFFYTRTYTLITKHQSEHYYKGNYRPDYYITVKYDDDSNFYWTKSIGGASYFSMTEGRRYEEKAETQRVSLVFLILCGFFLVGSTFLAIFMVDIDD